MKLLFIEDEYEVAEAAISLLGSDAHQYDIGDFNSLNEKNMSFLPDIIVLDLMKGGKTVDPTGKEGKSSFDTIWDNRFCPIVIYSANPDLIDDIDPEKSKHPLVGKVKKGKNIEPLQEKIEKFKPCIEGMNKITEDVNKVLHSTLRDIAPKIFTLDGIVKKEVAIQHMGRRRISVLMDDSSLLRPMLAPEEQHIFPPLGDYPKTGDIIRSISGDKSNPESYRIVLTPSCDLVKIVGRDPKVTEVLCARCEKPKVSFAKAQIRFKEENIIKVLRDGYIKEFLPIPGFKGVIPPMVANLKALELISYNSIGNERASGIDYIRVTSVDSPFREQIAWAYQNTSCRPGVPDRDCDSWAKQYLDDDSDKGEENS